MYTSIISCVALLLSLSSFSLAGEAGTTVTLAPSLPTDAPSYVDNAKFRSAILNSTNFFRKQHGASPLKWNESLENFGDDHSEDCKFEHSGGPDGENLAEGYANVTSSVDAWGNERDKYDFNDQGFNHDTGHFTQLVWKASQTVGCGRKWCDDKFTGWYLVCEYYPRGNVVGQFDQNVQKQTTKDGDNNTGDDAGGSGTINDHDGDDCPQGADCSSGPITRPNLALLAVVSIILFT